MQKNGENVFRFGFGRRSRNSRIILPESPFPIHTAMVDRLRDCAHHHDYLPSKGLLPLRASVANYLSTNYKLTHFEAENIIIGPGSKELMYLTQKILNISLLLPQASWVSYEPQANITNRRVEWVPTPKETGFRLTADILNNTALLKGPPKMCILNYPNNPTGCSYTSDELKDLADWFRANKVIVLSDEIYSELNFARRHRSIAEYYPEGTIVSTGLSKWASAGGWRLGAFAIPSLLRPLLDTMGIVATETFSAVCDPVQHAAITAFDMDDGMKEYIEAERIVLRSVARRSVERLHAAGIEVTPPEGAFYMFPILPDTEKLAKHGITENRSLCTMLLKEAGVAVLPGSDFGIPDLLGFRLAFVDYEDAGKALQMAKIAAKEGRDELTDDEIKETCSRTIDGIEALAQWYEQL